MASFVDEQHMCCLYEKFILEYFSKEYPTINVRASQIPWALDDGIGTMLSIMQSDITLTCGSKVLIIDAKYYAHTTQVQYDKHTDLSETLYLEGAQKQILCNRYERNPKARARCIAAHGSACKMCGFDFGKVYGETFSGKIEVHHIKAISEIGEEYVVDPMRDLVPVCPNCHRMLHSKADGVYTIEELKSMYNRSKEKQG